jgi:hypothetical protein
MTRKDFELIADAFQHVALVGFASQEKGKRLSGVTVHATLARTLADALAADNPRFDRERFLTACGIS